MCHAKVKQGKPRYISNQNNPKTSSWLIVSAFFWGQPTGNIDYNLLFPFSACWRANMLENAGKAARGKGEPGTQVETRWQELGYAPVSKGLRIQRTHEVMSACVWIRETPQRRLSLKNGREMGPTKKREKNEKEMERGGEPRGGREERGGGGGGGRGKGGEEEGEQVLQEQGSNQHARQNSLTIKDTHIYGNCQVLQNLDSNWETPNVGDGEEARPHQTLLGVQCGLKSGTFIGARLAFPVLLSWAWKKKKTKEKNVLCT